jgi:Ca-activated chloride channel family protein
VIAPRYGDQAAAGLAPHQQVESDLLAEYPFTLEVLLEGAVGEGMVSCPTHAISTGRRPDGLLVRLDEGGCLDRDFVLRVDGLGAMPLSSTARDGKGFVTLASFAPPPPVKAVGAPLALHLLVDCSGSMAGESIDSARRALDLLANALGERDRVTLTCFGSSISPRIESPLGMAGRAELREAIAAIDADLGGTEMESALLHVLGLAREHGGDVLVLTDGEVWQSEEVINTAVRGGQRVFTIGVGMSPSEGLLVRLAQATGGEATFVTPGEAVVEAVRRTMSRLMQPAATDVAITWPGPVEWATRLPRAVFAGETVHVFARSAEPLVGQAVLSWTGDGEHQQADVLLASPAADVDPESEERDIAALPRIAAFHRLGELDEEAAGALAEAYGLVTSATSMVLSLKRSAEEKAVEQPELRKVAQMLAAGHAGMGVMRGLSEPMMMSRRSAGPAYSVSREAHYSASAMLPMERSVDRPAKRVAYLKASFDSERSASVTPMSIALEEIGLTLLPTTLEELFAYGTISDDVRSLLEARLAQGVDEQALVLAFVAALLKASPNRRQLRSEILTLRTQVEQMTGGSSPDDVLGPDLVVAAGGNMRA